MTTHYGTPLEQCFSFGLRGTQQDTSLQLLVQIKSVKGLKLGSVRKEGDAPAPTPRSYV